MTSLLDDKLDFNVSNYNDFIDVSEKSNKQSLFFDTRLKPEKILLGRLPGVLTPTCELG